MSTSQSAAATALSALASQALRVSDLARNALTTSEARYRRLFETAQDGILLLNAATAQIEDVNPYLIRMLGYTHEEFLGRKLWEVGAFADMAQSKEMFEKLQSEGYVRYDDLPLKTKSGARIEVEFVSNSYDCEGVTVIQCNIRDISEKHRVDAENVSYVEKLRVALMGTVEIATMLSELRDPYTAGHERRTAALAVAIGTELGLDATRIEGLRVAGFLHDVGKISVPTEILAKPGHISAIEHGLITAHCQTGYEVLKTVQWPWPVAEVALQHHERGRGTAYDPAASDACLKVFRDRGFAFAA